MARHLQLDGSSDTMCSATAKARPAAEPGALGGPGRPQLERGIADGAFRENLDVQATADVVCQLQSDYSGRAYRNDARFPDDPRIINAVVGLIRAAVGTIGD